MSSPSGISWLPFSKFNPGRCNITNVHFIIWNGVTVPKWFSIIVSASNELLIAFPTMLLKGQKSGYLSSGKPMHETVCD